METVHKNIKLFKKEIEESFWGYNGTQTAFKNLINSVKETSKTITKQADNTFFKNTNIYVLYKLYDTILGKKNCNMSIEY